MSGSVLQIKSIKAVIYNSRNLKISLGLEHHPATLLCIVHKSCVDKF